MQPVIDSVTAKHARWYYGYKLAKSVRWVSPGTYHTIDHTYDLTRVNESD